MGFTGFGESSQEIDNPQSFFGQRQVNCHGSHLFTFRSENFVRLRSRRHRQPVFIQLLHKAQFVVREYSVGFALSDSILCEPLFFMNKFASFLHERRMPVDIQCLIPQDGLVDRQH
ncbi:hypothetical protein ES703_125738 [subsurface metagenome]